MKHAARVTAPHAVNSQHALLAIWIAAIVLMLLTWWQVFHLVSESRVREITSAERDLANITRVSQEHASRTLRSADQVIRFVQSRYLEVGNRLDLKDLTAKGVIDAEIFNQVGIIDPHGILILSNRQTHGRLDLSDREHFRVHIAADTGQLFVSKPVIGRTAGNLSIQLTRRITRANGEFAGVVVVSMDPGYFTRFYGDIQLGSKGLAALYGLDGVARARRVGDKEDFGVSAPSALMFARIAKGEEFGTYTNRSPVDGIERLYYYRKIPQYPLVVTEGLDMQELLNDHRSDRNALLLQATVVTVLILALAAALSRYLLQIRQAIAERQFALTQTQDRTEQLNAIFVLSPDGFVAFDRERRVKYVSPAFLQMMAPGPVQVEGFDETEFSAWLKQRCESETPFAGLAALRSEVTAGTPDAHQLIEINRNGKRMLQVGLRCSESSTVSQILYFRDVTHEAEVDQMKSEFLSTAAHELRTPMASVYGFSEVLLAQEFDAATQREFLTIIYQQSKLMSEILDELLDLARIEARRGKDFRYTRVCLQELAADVVKAFKLPPNRALPELLTPEQPLYVMADAGKLRQAILNVLSNAYKYSPEGGTVRMEVDAKGVADVPATVCIHVTDHGMGMTQKQLERVCERFYRADNSGSIPGTGLGMSIVKEIIELHGGRVTLSSTFGQGTRVSLILPG
ncbi:ATP-binding protein [Rhodoferax sp.]|uniref:ATP-binding protein n=1 Tax=Rhodoferax sp. TaxID=50421 RepID=UPI0028431E21|nr:ATP-binding protein [Rhodoferax sp.]MDR3368669.1 ATP-binding protein [Rhodoferax sp.]